MLQRRGLRTGVRWTVLAISLALGLAALPASAVTNTITVTGRGDGGGSCVGNSCPTLRSAITKANGESNDTILLAGGAPYAVTSELTITASMTISGDGMSASVIDAGGGSRVLRISGGNVTLQALTVQNGSSADGAGILIQRGTLGVKLSAVGVANNQATNYAAGVENNETTLVIDGSVVSGNRVVANANTADPNVGGVASCCSSAAKTFITNTTISGNSVTNNSGQGNPSHAGGVANYFGSMTIVGSTLSGNSVSGAGAGGGPNGGGIVACCSRQQDPTSKLSVTNSTITGN